MGEALSVGSVRATPAPFASVDSALVRPPLRRPQPPRCKRATGGGASAKTLYHSTARSANSLVIWLELTPATRSLRICLTRSTTAPDQRRRTPRPTPDDLVVHEFGLRVVCLARTEASARTWAQYVREELASHRVNQLRNDAGYNAGARYAMRLARARRPKACRAGERLVLETTFPDFDPMMWADSIKSPVELLRVWLA